MLIFNLTLNRLHINPDEGTRVTTHSNCYTIRSEQILTEQGICYITNNYLASNLSAK